MNKNTKMIKVTSRGTVTTSRGIVFAPIVRPYRESVDTIFGMLTRDEATVIEILDNGTEVKLTPQNFDKDNSIQFNKPEEKKQPEQKTPTPVIPPEPVKPEEKTEEKVQDVTPVEESATKTEDTKPEASTESDDENDCSPVEDSNETDNNQNNPNRKNKKNRNRNNKSLEVKPESVQ